MTRRLIHRAAVLAGVACFTALGSMAQPMHSASQSAAKFPHEFRPIDGEGTNPRHPSWGAAGMPFARVTSTAYADGYDLPAGPERPGAREISNAVLAQNEDEPSLAGATDMVWQWGQFLDHDIDLTPVIDPPEPFDIAIPAGDPWFDPGGTGAVSIPLERSFYVHVRGVREQVNEITAYIDASNVYGSDAARALELRALDGTGKLKMSAGDLLPFNVNGYPNAPDSGDPSYFLAGDFRANEQVALTAMHTVFAREHNYWAERIQSEPQLFAEALDRPVDRGPSASGERHRMNRDDFNRRSAGSLSGDEIYELARAIVAAELQAITYNEFLPVLLGPDALDPYGGFRPAARPDVRNAFATSAYRFGHSMLSDSLLRLDRSGESIGEGPLALAAAFFQPAELIEHGIEPLLRGLCIQRAQEVDAQLVDGVRNFLFGPPGAGGFDLAALNIQRGRDHGLPGYNRLRRDLGLQPRGSLTEVSSDRETVARLASVYGSIEEVDSWVGGLAEDHVAGALVGETVLAVLKDQFEALRDGDRFWYQVYLPSPLVELVERQSLTTILQRNTRIGSELPADVFLVARR